MDAQQLQVDPMEKSSCISSLHHPHSLLPSAIRSESLATASRFFRTYARPSGFLQRGGPCLDTFARFFHFIVHIHDISRMPNGRVRIRRSSHGTKKHTMAGTSSFVIVKPCYLVPYFSSVLSLRFSHVVHCTQCTKTSAGVRASCNCARVTFPLLAVLGSIPEWRLAACTGFTTDDGNNLRSKYQHFSQPTSHRHLQSCFRSIVHATKSN